MSGSLSYSPRWCSWVVGTYDPRVVDPETGQADPQIIRMTCSRCGAVHRVSCNSGAVRSWVNRFASVHLHGDVMDPARVRAMAEAGKAGRQ